MFDFRTDIATLLDSYRPSRHRFFALLESAPSAFVHTDRLLEELYKRYQAAMHATRVMVYHLPHLDSIDLRVKKIEVLMDDDAGVDGDTHHYQLRRTWTSLLGRPPAVGDDWFGELDELVPNLDPDTANFVRQAQALYPVSLGPWLVVEGLAHDWIGALLRALLPHFPSVGSTDYFRENYHNCIEIEHAESSLECVCTVIRRKPALRQATLSGAAEMGGTLDRLWRGLEDLLK